MHASRDILKKQRPKEDVVHPGLISSCPYPISFCTPFRMVVDVAAESSSSLMFVFMRFDLV